MHIDSYHHLTTATVPGDGITGEWLESCLANARATLLHRLEFTSARLRVRGLRLRVLPPETPPCPSRVYQALASALTIVAVDEELRVRETLYTAAESSWHRYWHGYSLIGVTRNGEPEPLPQQLRSEARAWLRLSRGCLEHAGPVEAAAGERSADSAGR
ncbi:hypothetical protein [Arhodomonas sp. AD133]|uniref:hypothetical protein n=1 Tax=Arhodomonas sp. AD133 TaxID=3415009 RepID=UPI003EB9309F